MERKKSDKALVEKESKRRGSAILIQNAVRNSQSKKKAKMQQDKKRRDSAVLIAKFVKKNSGRAVSGKLSSSSRVSPTNSQRTKGLSESKRRGSAIMIQQAWKQKRASSGKDLKKGGGDGDMFVPQASASSKAKKSSGKFSPSTSISEANKPPPKRGGCMGGDNAGPSQILRNLWLGNREDSMNLKLLRSLGIKYILNATAQLDNCFEGQLKYLKINVKDKEGVELTPYFEKCTDFIARGVNDGGVLVHCIAGASRSVTFVLVYLMSSQGERLCLRDAFNFVKARRTCAHPNASFMVQLAKYEIKLHDGGSSIAKAKEKIFSSYELNTLKKEKVKNHIPSGKLKIDAGGGCIVS